MMSQSADWKYCVVGNITKSHSDENGTVRYGTPAFTGGTKVYLCGKYWDPSRKTIEVIGITRGSRKYHVIDTNPAYIENVRCSKTYHPAVLDIMNNWEMQTLWWGNSETDKHEAAVFVYNWKTGFSNAKASVLTQFTGKAVTNIKAYGIDEFDFTPALGGVDFSVGQFGYAALEFGDSSIYISVDGLSTVVPPRSNIKELPVKERVRNCFIGAVLKFIEFDGKTYWIQFDGFETLRGFYSPNDGHTDRSYFELEFPWF